ncbi:alkaline phosphatase family protein [Cobetia sp. 4B]|uniref:alkaline phosphatase family protein n=1 Tax=Cobetia sp. 4B TaxID=2758724 RepID=UPI001C04B161|nr:alkaline phosphatase family protein [Cobetia sp. 4B]QWN38212.1 alkaline phosphatase family protein [Cobetia sp. 4B]
MSRPGLILILMDGISSQRFAETRARLPHLDALARDGLLIERLGADTNANSMPARAGILTGQPAQVHGIYSNGIYSNGIHCPGAETETEFASATGTETDRDSHASDASATAGHFRPAAVEDLRGETLLEAARAAGLRVASLGFGLARPESCDWYLSPWWEDGDLRAKGMTAPRLNHWDARNDALMRAMSNDQQLLNEALSLIERETPELVLLELNTPDYCLHVHGNDDALVDGALMMVDAQLGSLLAGLEAINKREAYHLCVFSDHGHAPVQRALVADRLLPDVALQCDGGLLLVACDDDERQREQAARLAEFGVTPLAASDFLPPDVKHIQLYQAPPGMSFEPACKHAHHAELVAAPSYVSTHGFGPGATSDQRFAILHGPSITAGERLELESLALHPRLRQVLGLPPLGEASTPQRAPDLQEVN